MMIGNQNLFIGAYAERVSDGRIPMNLPDLVNLNKRETAVQFVEDTQGVRFSKPDYDTMTVSGEARKLYETMMENTEKSLAAMYGYYMDKQTELQKNDPADPFWGSTGNQWLVFSGHLYSNGFYDGMTDEQVKSVEQLLDKITGEIDRFHRMSYGIGMNINAVPGKADVIQCDSRPESGELWMELESSTTVLRMFGEKMIEDEELRKEFNSLVDQYYEHNVRILVRHRTPSEVIKQFREGNGSYAEFLEACDQRVNELLGQMEKEAAEDFQNKGNTNITGAITESESYVQELHKIFEQLRQGISDWNTAKNLLKEAYAEYDLKGNEKQNLISELPQQTKENL